VAKVGTSKSGGTISQQAAVHLWLAADAHVQQQQQQQQHMELIVHIIINVKLSVCIIKHHAALLHGGVELKFHTYS
jgi:hypothetical protein